MAGVTVVAWYPDYAFVVAVRVLIAYMKKYRSTRKRARRRSRNVQAEDEIASLGMVIGASWAVPGR